MNRKITLALLAVALFIFTSANAQTPETKSKNRFLFGIGLNGALPMSALKDAPNNYKIGGGLDLRFTQELSKSFALTLTGGAIAFIPEDLDNLTIDSKASLFVPIKLGGRVMLGNTFYVMGEAGVVITKIYQYTGSTVNGSTTTVEDGFVNGSSFTYAPSIGVRFGKFDLGVRYEGISDVTGGKELVAAGQSALNDKKGGFAGLRIAFDF